MAIHHITYLWGADDALQALGLTSKQIEDLKWVKRLGSQPINTGAYEKLPCPEEAREIQDAALRANPYTNQGR